MPIKPNEQSTTGSIANEGSYVGGIVHFILHVLSLCLLVCVEGGRMICREPREHFPELRKRRGVPQNKNVTRVYVVLVEEIL
jgi:hypothetical protein